MGGWLGGSLSFLKQRKHSSLPRRPCLSWADTACPGAPAGPLLLREGRPRNAPCHLGPERDEIEKRVKTPRLPALGGAQGTDRALWNRLFLLRSCPITAILAETSRSPRLGTASRGEPGNPITGLTGKRRVQIPLGVRGSAFVQPGCLPGYS